MRAAAFALVALCMTATVLPRAQASAQATAPAPSLRLAGGADEDAAAGVFVDGAAAYPLSTLTRFGAVVSMGAAESRAILFGDTLVFATGSPFFRTGAGVHQLAYPVSRVDSEVYLPEQFFLEWLPSRFDDRLAFRGGTLHSTEPLVAYVPARAPAPAPVERIVVVDPGHGGRDSGKIGPNGLAEKDIVLAIGVRLAALLEERGYEVHLTRERDTLIALADRPHLANQWKGTRQRALFVSIHANSWQPSVRGFETYFLSDARTEDARRVEEMENSAQAFEDGDGGDLEETDLILNSLRNDFYVRASNDLAEVVQRSLAEFHSGPNRGVKQAGFRVLVGALMPAVLVETAYLSNPREARLLGTAEFQQDLANGIADAIDRFFAQHEHLWAAGSP